MTCLKFERRMNCWFVPQLKRFTQCAKRDWGNYRLKIALQVFAKISIFIASIRAKISFAIAGKFNTHFPYFDTSVSNQSVTSHENVCTVAVKTFPFHMCRKRSLSVHNNPTSRDQKHGVVCSILTRCGCLHRKPTVLPNFQAGAILLRTVRFTTYMRYISVSKVKSISRFWFWRTIHAAFGIYPVNVANMRQSVWQYAVVDVYTPYANNANMLTNHISRASRRIPSSQAPVIVVVPIYTLFA